MVTDKVRDTLTNIAQRADFLQKWAYTNWKLESLQVPTIQVKEKACWLCGKKTVTKTNPEYTKAKEVERLNHYDEILALSKAIATENAKIEKLRSLTQKFDLEILRQMAEKDKVQNVQGSTYVGSTADNFSRIDQAVSTIHDNVNEAVRKKQQNATWSISTELANINEAYSLVFREFKQIATETVDFNQSTTKEVVEIIDQKPEVQNNNTIVIAGLILLAAIVYTQMKKS